MKLKRFLNAAVMSTSYIIVAQFSVTNDIIYNITVIKNWKKTIIVIEWN